MNKNKVIVQLEKVLLNYGVGIYKQTNAKKNVGINLRNKIRNVKIKSLNRVNKLFNSDILGRKLILENKDNYDFLIKLKTYKGNRHKFGYPARGQRTHTNAKTKKKLRKKV